MTPDDNQAEAFWRERANERRARRRIEKALARTLNRGEVPDRPTARLIAASLHPSTNSALADFAGLDLLDARAALRELENLHRPAPAHWTYALGAFVLDCVEQCAS